MQLKALKLYKMLFIFNIRFSCETSIYWTFDLCQFWHPEPDEIAIWIVVESLLDHVELPVLARVVADAGRVVPVAVVAAHVVVQLKNIHFCQICLTREFKFYVKQIVKVKVRI